MVADGFPFVKVKGYQKHLAIVPTTSAPHCRRNRNRRVGVQYPRSEPKVIPIYIIKFKKKMYCTVSLKKQIHELNKQIQVQVQIQTYLVD
jgi:hypothetical protein